MLLHELTALGKSARQFIDERTKGLNISSTEQSACVYIYLHSSPNQETIARALEMDKGNAAKMMLSLENQGLVKRTVNPKNRREYIIELTDAGTDIISVTLNAAKAWEEEVLKGLAPEEKALFLATVKKARVNSHAIMLNGMNMD